MLQFILEPQQILKSLDLRERAHPNIITVTFDFREFESTCKKNII